MAATITSRDRQNDAEEDGEIVPCSRHDESEHRSSAVERQQRSPESARYGRKRPRSPNVEDEYRRRMSSQRDINNNNYEKKRRYDQDYFDGQHYGGRGGERSFVERASSEILREGRRANDVSSKYPKIQESWNRTASPSSSSRGRNDYYRSESSEYFSTRGGGNRNEGRISSRGHDRSSTSTTKADYHYHRSTDDRNISRERTFQVDHGSRHTTNDSSSRFRFNQSNSKRSPERSVSPSHHHISSRPLYGNNSSEGKSRQNQYYNSKSEREHSSSARRRPSMEMSSSSSHSMRNRPTPQTTERDSSPRYQHCSDYSRPRQSSFSEQVRPAIRTEDSRRHYASPSKEKSLDRKKFYNRDSNESSRQRERRYSPDGKYRAIVTEDCRQPIASMNLVSSKGQATSSNGRQYHRTDSVASNCQKERERSPEKPPQIPNLHLLTRRNSGGSVSSPSTNDDSVVHSKLVGRFIPVIPSLTPESTRLTVTPQLHGGFAVNSPALNSPKEALKMLSIPPTMLTTSTSSNTPKASITCTSSNSQNASTTCTISSNTQKASTSANTSRLTVTPQFHGRFAVNLSPAQSSPKEALKMLPIPPTMLTTSTSQSTSSKASVTCTSSSAQKAISSSNTPKESTSSNTPKASTSSNTPKASTTSTSPSITSTSPSITSTSPSTPKAITSANTPTASTSANTPMASTSANTPTASTKSTSPSITSTTLNTPKASTSPNTSKASINVEKVSPPKQEQDKSSLVNYGAKLFTSVATRAPDMEKKANAGIIRSHSIPFQPSKQATASVPPGGSSLKPMVSIPSRWLKPKTIKKKESIVVKDVPIDPSATSKSQTNALQSIPRRSILEKSQKPDTVDKKDATNQTQEKLVGSKSDSGSKAEEKVRKQDLAEGTTRKAVTNPPPITQYKKSPKKGFTDQTKKKSNGNKGGLDANVKGKVRRQEETEEAAWKARSAKSPIITYNKKIITKKQEEPGATPDLMEASFSSPEPSSEEKHDSCLPTIVSEDDVVMIDVTRERKNQLQLTARVETFDSRQNHYIQENQEDSDSSELSESVDEATSSSDDSDTDEEELMEWAQKMFGVSPQGHRPMRCVELNGDHSQSEGRDHALKLKLRLASDKKAARMELKASASNNEEMPRKKKKKRRRYSNYNSNYPPCPQITEEEARLAAEENRRRKELAKPLTAAEVKEILADDDMDYAAQNWVRRSTRQPCRSLLSAPRVRSLIEKLKANDTDMIVLKMKKYLSDPDAPPAAIDIILDALEENTNCEALYIQNFNLGMRDEQVLHLLRILQLPSCKIWCLNIGETYNVKSKTWTKFARGLRDTKVTHMYASEHTISTELKDEIRETIRLNRRKHDMHCNPSNLETIIQCTHCWWNPVNTKALRPYLRNRGFEHILNDKEHQGLRGSSSVAPS